jgi:hypothetical protein
MSATLDELYCAGDKTQGSLVKLNSSVYPLPDDIQETG